MQTEDMNPREHPHYGELIYTASGLLVCHICGKAFTKLGGPYMEQAQNIDQRLLRDVWSGRGQRTLFRGV